MATEDARMYNNRRVPPYFGARSFADVESSRRGRSASRGSASQEDTAPRRLSTHNASASFDDPSVSAPAGFEHLFELNQLSKITGGVGDLSSSFASNQQFPASSLGSGFESGPGDRLVNSAQFRQNGAGNGAGVISRGSAYGGGPDARPYTTDGWLPGGTENNAAGEGTKVPAGGMLGVLGRLSLSEKAARARASSPAGVETPSGGKGQDAKRALIYQQYSESENDAGVEEHLNTQEFRGLARSQGSEQVSTLRASSGILSTGAESRQRPNSVRTAQSTSVYAGQTIPKPLLPPKPSHPSYSSAGRASTLQMAITPVTPAHNPSRMLQANPGMTTRQLTKGMQPHMWEYRHKGGGEAFAMQATFSSSRLPHIPSLTSPPPMTAAPNAPQRPYGGKVQPALNEKSFQELHCQARAKVQGAAQGETAERAADEERAGREVDTSNKERPSDGGDLSDDEQRHEVETEVMKARRELVEARMRILPSLHTMGSGNCEMMELTMTKWASMAAGEEEDLNNLNDKLTADLVLLDKAIKNCAVIPLRLRVNRPRSPNSSKFRSTSPKTSPGGKANDSRAMFHGEKHGFDEINAYLDYLDERFPKMVKQVRRQMVQGRPNWFNTKSMFDGKPPPRAPTHDETFRMLDMKLYVNDDGARELTRHELEPRSGVALYEAGCRDRGIDVLTRVCEMLNNKEGNLAMLRLGREGGASISPALACNTVMHGLNLQKNELQGPTLEAVIRSLTENDTLLEIDLSGNSFRHIHGGKPGKALAALLKKRSTKLRRLVLNECEIGDDVILQICPVLQDFNKTLEVLELAGNKISDVGALSFGNMLLYNTHLKKVDLSWNTFKTPGAKGICNGLKQNMQLTDLNLAWNGLEDSGACHFGAMLRQNHGLQRLDLSHTRCGPEACLVFSESLRHNTSLKHLKLDHNPLGDDGGRHLMVMLQDNDVVESLTMEGCSFVKAIKPMPPPPPAAVGKKKKRVEPPPPPPPPKAPYEFNKHDADGEHSFNLSALTDRAILGLLLGMEEVAPGSILDAKHNGRKLPPHELHDGSWFKGELPEGTFTCRFAAKLKGKPKIPEAIEPEDLDNLLAQMASPIISDRDRVMLVQLFCTVYYFWAEQARRILDSFYGGMEKRMAAVMLYFCIIDGHNTEVMLPIEAERNQMVAELGSHAHFRTTNASGRYRLDLSLSADRYMAMQLVESAILEGGARSWRNCTLNGRHIKTVLGSPGEWLGNNTPSNGVLVLDYTSSAVPSPNTPIAKDDELAKFIFEEVANPITGAMDGPECINRLRERSVFLYISAVQARDIVDQFKDHAERVEAAVILRSRVVDQQNMYKMIYVLHMLEQQFLMSRLGPNQYLNENHCTGRYRLNTKDFEHFAVARQLGDLAGAESDFQSWHALYVNGKQKKQNIAENSRMFSVIVGSEKPIIEFDYVGSDIWEMFKMTMPNDRRTRDTYLQRYAHRRLFKRMLFLHPLWKKVLTQKKEQFLKANPNFKKKEKGLSAVMLAFGMDVHQAKSEAPSLQDLYPDRSAQLSKKEEPLPEVPKDNTVSTKEPEESIKASMLDSPFLKAVRVKNAVVDLRRMHPEKKEEVKKPKGKKSWLSSQTIRKKVAKVAESEASNKNQEAWQAGWDQMLHELVAEEAEQRDVEEKDRFKPPLQIYFEAMDRQQKGFLTPDEFVKGLREDCALGDVLTTKDAKAWFKETDVTGDNEISWEEFEELCLKRLTYFPDFRTVDV